MLLHGWKEIATYLRCGVRTAQRWETFGMPVTRIRDHHRGPVIARTEKLDAWLNPASDENKGRPHRRVQVHLTHAAEIHVGVRKQLRTLLGNEVRLGLGLAKMASRTRNQQRAKRFGAMARQAYDAILRLSVRMKFSEAPSPQFDKELEELKVSLRRLGEKV